MFHLKPLNCLNMKFVRYAVAVLAVCSTVCQGANSFIWLHTNNSVDLYYHYTDGDTEPSPSSPGWNTSTMESLDSLLNTHIQNHWWDDGAYIRFGYGMFWTYGIGSGGGDTLASYPTHGYATIVSGGATYPRIDIKGKGMANTTLKLQNSAPVNWGPNPNGINGFNWVVIPDGWVKNFYLSYLQLDYNWSGQAQPIYPGSACAGSSNSKIDPAYKGA